MPGKRFPRARSWLSFSLGLGLAAFGLVAHAEAGGLRVAPIFVRMTAQQPMTTVQIWNDNRTPLGVQIRVFSWHVVDGRNVLEPTRDVVASPPIATLAPGAENVIRVVRVSSQPVRTVEKYRLLIDELPHAHQRAGTVDVLVRQALPVTISP
ncbi:MAG: fimbria/pilus periplasmic chaperone [Devosia sp.]|nr:fimbria/pilus periplasmic chaperone [Devosia sp.]